MRVACILDWCGRMFGPLGSLLVTLPLAAAPAPPVAAPASSDVPAHIPAEGIGLLVGGAIAIGGGIGLVGAGYAGCSSSDVTCAEADRRKWAYAGFGIAAVGIGLVAGGSIVKSRFDAWRDQRKLRVPKRGNGLFVGGGTLIGFAALAWGVAANDRSSSKNAVILGTIWTLGGAGMVAGGAVMRVRYRKWKQQRFDYALAPMMLPKGGGVSMRARF